MAQLGSGQGSSYPYAIDTRQTFVNATPTAPDSPTRIDAEFANDDLQATINVETALGANVQGNFASLAARLNQFMPGGGTVPNVQAFADRVAFTIAGAVHHLGSPAILYQVYDTSTPRQALEPSTVTVDPTTYDLTMTFAVPQSGVLVLGAPSPQYVATFSEVLTLPILGTTHGLDHGALFYQLYDANNPAAVLEPGALTIHPITFDVEVSFAVPQSGILILTAGGPRYATSFTNQSIVLIPGNTHNLPSAALLYQVYDSGTPATAITPQSVTVDPVNFDVTVSFSSAQSGTIALTSVAALSGQDFEIRDSGLVDQTAVRVLSGAGRLYLQAGAGEHVVLRNKTAEQIVVVNMLDRRMGIGVPNPLGQLHLSTGPAIKPDSNVWSVGSDERLKEVQRPYTDGLEVILQVEPVWFRYNGKGGMPVTGKDLVSIVAQQLQPIAPYMVGSYLGQLTPDTEATEILTYEGHAMTFALINAVKELHARVVALEAAQRTPQATPAPTTSAEEVTS